MKNTIIKVWSFVCAIFAFLLGDFDFLLKAIIALMFLDYVTGICKAFTQKKVNSTIGANGIVKKVVYLCIIAIAVILDQLLNMGGSFRTLIITTFIFNEILSILENCCEMGIKAPKVLYETLEKINLSKEIEIKK